MNLIQEEKTSKVKQNDNTMEKDKQQFTET